MRRRLVTLCREAEPLAATAEKIPLPDASVDAVFAAEAFHVFDGDRALAQIARVLRPGGALILLWNVPAGPWMPSTASAEQLLQERGPKPTRCVMTRWTSTGLNTHWANGVSHWANGVSRSRACPFEPLRETRVPNVQALDREGLVAFFASMGWLADLPDEERLPLLEEVRSLLPAADYRRRWETHLHWTHLR
jgi:SAM-dependent methyltransferase